MVHEVIFHLKLLTLLLLIFSVRLIFANNSFNESLMLANTTSDVSITSIHSNYQLPIDVDSDARKEIHSNSVTNVLKPTDEWQTIQPNQSIPAGCDIRISFETGKKEARWSAGRNTDKFRVSTQNNSDFLPLFPVYDTYKPPEFTSTINTEDYNTSLRFIELLREAENSTSVLHILDELDILLSNGDLAQLISMTDHFSFLISLLNSRDLNISSATCLVLGSMWQNNQQIQLIAIERKILTSLVDLLVNYKEVHFITNSLLFATSTLLRGLPYGLGMHYFTHYGLAELFTKIMSCNRDQYKTVLKVLRLTEYLLEEFKDENDLQLELKRRAMHKAIHTSEYCTILREILSMLEHEIIKFYYQLCSAV